jgi:hypothetical protein
MNFQQSHLVLSLLPHDRLHTRRRLYHRWQRNLWMKQQ